MLKIVYAGGLSPHSSLVSEDTWEAPNNPQVSEDAAELRYLHAWVLEGGDSLLIDSYKFRHHEVVGGPANLKAINISIVEMYHSKVLDSVASDHLRSHRKDHGLNLHLSAEEVKVAVNSYALISQLVKEKKDHLTTLVTEMENIDIKFHDSQQHSHVHNQAIANLVQEAILYETEFVNIKETVAQESDLIELSVGRVLEALPSDDGPMKLKIEMIQPGWGNPKDNMYYDRSVLKEHIGIFRGAKMFETNHKTDEIKNSTWVSTVLEVGEEFSENGAPIAIIGIHKEHFAKEARNLQELGILDQLKCSIRAAALVRPNFKRDGRKGQYVQEFTKALSVDWVSHAGAGGKAIQIQENDDMKNKKKKVEEEDVKEALIEEGEGEAETGTKETVLSESDVTALMPKNMPEQIKQRILNEQYPTVVEANAAIIAELDYVRELTGSGSPIGLGENLDSTPEPQPLTEVEAQEAYDQIFADAGLPV